MFGYKEEYRIKELDVWFTDENLISESVELGYTIEVYRCYLRDCWNKVSEIELEY